MNKLGGLLLAPWSMCTSAIVSFFLHLCTFCRLGYLSRNIHSLDLRIGWFNNLSFAFPVYVLYIYTPFVCFRMFIFGQIGFKTYTTFNNGSLGSRIDEERSEMR